MPKTLLDRANEALDKKKMTEALALFEQAISENPNDAIAYQDASRCHFQTGDFEEAMAMCNKAIAIDSRLAIPHALLAEIYDETGDKINSRKEARIAYDMDPDSPTVLLAYGGLLFADGDIDGAVSVLEEGLRLDPKNYRIHHNLIGIYYQKGEIQKGLLHERKKFFIKPSFRNAMLLLHSYLVKAKWVRLFSPLFLIITVLAVLLRVWWMLILSAVYILLLMTIGVYMRILIKSLLRSKAAK